MGKITLRSIAVVTAFGGFITISAVQGPKQRIQPASATLYSGSDSASKSNPQAMYLFDSHGNEIQCSKGSFTSMEIEEHEYNYDKGYAVLLNNYYYTLDKTGCHDTVYLTRTILDDKGIRTGYMCTSGWDEVDNFKFDEAGHITSLELNGDTTLLTWNGDQLDTYNHYMPSKSVTSQIKLDEVEVFYARTPLNCMDYNFDDIISDFRISGVFVNAKGYFQHKISWYKIDVSGNLDVKSAMIGTDSIRSVATINDTVTLYVQECKFLDDNGSYRLRIYQPALASNADDYVEYEVWFNEYGDEVKALRTEAYPAYNEYYTTKTEDPVEYEDNKPLRKMHYYFQKNDKVLGNVLEYDSWHDEPVPSAIRNMESTETCQAALYLINGQKVADLTKFQVETGRYNVPDKGIYIIREQTPAGVKSRKVMRKQ
ncbi:MAG: hypothetical protein ACI4BA_03450 [Prevotella sp.]